MCEQESSASAPTHQLQSHPQSTAAKLSTMNGEEWKRRDVLGDSEEKKAAIENTSRQPGG